LQAKSCRSLFQKLSIRIGWSRPEAVAMTKFFVNKNNNLQPEQDFFRQVKKSRTLLNPAFVFLATGGVSSPPATRVLSALTLTLQGSTFEFYFY